MDALVRRRWLLAAAGAEVTEVDPGFADPLDAFHVFWWSGAAKVLRGLRRVDDRVDPGLRRCRRRDGVHASRTSSTRQHPDGARIADGPVPRQYDVLVTPTLPIPAFLVGQDVPDGRPSPDWTSWTPYTYPFNLTQQPALECPVRVHPAGLPVGLQIVAAAHADALDLARRAGVPSGDRLASPHPNLGGTMSRFVTVSLDKRDVSCVARLLDDVAPRTCAAVWDSLPLSAPVFHGKYARNEIYTLLPGFATRSPRARRTRRSRRSRATCAGSRSTPTIWATRRTGTRTRPDRCRRAIVDLAVFYGRNNLLINGDQGWVPGNVFGAITENLDELAAACQDLWMGGARGETLTFARF